MSHPARLVTNGAQVQLSPENVYNSNFNMRTISGLQENPSDDKRQIPNVIPRN